MKTRMQRGGFYYLRPEYERTGSSATVKGWPAIVLFGCLAWGVIDVVRRCLRLLP